jgi:hypothetical protein
MSSASAPNRRSFLARSAAIAAVPAVAALAGSALAEPASAGTLPDYAPIPKSALGRLGTRDDMTVYQQYVDDIIAGVKKALVAVDPTPFFAKYGDNSWAAVQQYQKAQVDYATGPVIKKYTGVLAAADVYTASTAFVLLESIRLDLGVGSQVHA